MKSVHVIGFCLLFIIALAFSVVSEQPETIVKKGESLYDVGKVSSERPAGSIGGLEEPRKIIVVRVVE